MIITHAQMYDTLVVLAAKAAAIEMSEGSLNPLRQ